MKGLCDFRYRSCAKGFTVGLRPYYAENTGSHPNPEVKLHQARLVLGWGTTLEPCVLQAFFDFSQVLFRFSSPHFPLSHCLTHTLSHCSSLLYSCVVLCVSILYFERNPIRSTQSCASTYFISLPWRLPLPLIHRMLQSRAESLSHSALLMTPTTFLGFRIGLYQIYRANSTTSFTATQFNVPPSCLNPLTACPYHTYTHLLSLPLLHGGTTCTRANK